MISIFLIIVLVSAGGTIDVYLPPETTSTRFNDSAEGTKQVLSWARTRIPNGSAAKICIVETAELKSPSNLHSYLTKERQAAASALGTSYSVEFGPHKTMQLAVKLYGAPTVDYQIAKRVCN